MRPMKVIAVTALVAMIAVAATPLAAKGDDVSKVTIKGFASNPQEEVVYSPEGVDTVDIDVIANTTGNNTPYIFSVAVDYGPMVFNYNFGGTWNPETHDYESDLGLIGWAASDLHSVVNAALDIVANNISNNVINVKNHSNYPVTINYTFEKASADIFKDSAANPGRVMGVFSQDPNKLVLLRNYANFAAASSEFSGLSTLTDYDTVRNNLNLANAAFDLDVDDSVVSVRADVDNLKYAVLHTRQTTPVTTNTIYFGLTGQPGAAFNATNLTVGTIHVKVAPVAANKVVENVQP